MTALALLAAALGTPAGPCAAAARIDLPDLRVTATTPVAAGQGYRAPDARVEPVQVAFCRVEGVIEDEIGFELWLPAAGDWNGRLLSGGVGGQAGNFNWRELARGVTRGYAAASTDTGHKAAETHWLLANPRRAENYAHRANHLLALKMKAAIAQVYGRPVARSIFVGCSGGGRQAMTEAQRYPEDYDGIIAGAPGVDTPGMSARRMWEMQQHSLHAGLLTAADWAWVARRGVAACDDDDGKLDGVVENPALCRFDLATFGCDAPGTRAGSTCLAPAQLALVQKIYAPLVDENGRRVDDGLLPGVQVSPTPLPEPFTPGPPYLAVALFGDGVHQDPHWDAATFRIADDLPAIDRVMNLHADDPDLTRFRGKGGKLIMYQGWIDPLVSAQSTIGYFDALTARMGGAEATSKFARLYMVPGVEHCVGGPGADGFGGVGAAGLDTAPEHDMLSALEAWLDGGPTPGPIMAAKRSGGEVVGTHLLCPYPAINVDGACRAPAASRLQKPAAQDR